MRARIKKLATLKTAFYLLWMILGYGLGINVFCLLKDANDLNVQPLYGASGAFFALMVLYFIGEHHPDAIAGLLNRFKEATSGGWPWQQGRLWWVPFVLLISPAIPVCCYFESVYLRTYGYLESDAYFWFNINHLILTMLRVYVFLCLPFALLLCYGRSHARTWTRVSTILLTVLSVIANISMIPLWLYNDGAHALFSLILGLETPVLWVLTGTFSLAAILNIALGAFFHGQLKKTNPAPAPEPTPDSPWLARDLWIIMILPMLLIPFITSSSPLFTYGYLFLAPYVPALFFIFMRSSLKSFFWSKQGEGTAVQDILKISGKCLLLLLPALFCCYLDQFNNWISPKVFFPPLSAYHWYMRFTIVMLCAAGSEIMFRGIFWEFFSRRLGIKKTLVFLPLLTAALLGSVSNSWIVLSWLTAFLLVFHFSMTYLRYRTGSVLACIGVHVVIHFILWGHPVTFDLFHKLTRMSFQF